MTSKAWVAMRPRITKVGSAYRREASSGTCELCFAEWTAMIRDVSFGLDAAADDSATGAIKTSPELLPATVEHLRLGWSSCEPRVKGQKVCPESRIFTD